MKSISLNLNFAGTILPVVDCKDGIQRVPLKPICDVIGIAWGNQIKKIKSPYFLRRMGICVDEIIYAGQTRTMVLIRLDRVAAYLNTLNPESVRSAGNEMAADFLERKHCEWDDLIHAYEQQRGTIFQAGQYQKAIAMVRIDRMRDPVLKRLALAEIGVTIEEAASANPNGDLFAA